MKGPHWTQLVSWCVAFVVAIGVALFAHVIAIGHIQVQPTRKGIFSMEVAAFALILGAFVSGEVNRMARPSSHSPRDGPTFYQIFLVFFSLAASLSIYVALFRYFPN